jgi:error-prone DNA polymerase
MGGYSFARSHALSFALITYWHAWLHAKYPAAFFAATLANMPMGMYPVSTLLAEAKRRGVKLLRPNINTSAARPTLAAIDTIRLGLASVDGLSEGAAEAIVEVRGDMPFANLGDVVARTSLDRRVAEQLILAGAMDGLGGIAIAEDNLDSPHRRQLIWDLVAAFDQRDSGRLPLPHEAVRMKPFTRREQLSYEFGVLSGVVEGHLADLRAEDYARLDLTPVTVLNTLKAGTKVRVGGICTAPRRPPTASGVCFVMVDNPSGITQVIVPKAIYERDRAAIRSGFIVVEGRVQRRHGNVTVAAERVARVG